MQTLVKDWVKRAQLDSFNLTIKWALGFHQAESFKIYLNISNSK